MKRVLSTVDVASRFYRKPERRSVAPNARRRVGQGTTQLARHESHACTMSDKHHNRWSDRDVSRGQLIGGARCGVRVGGDLGCWPSSRTRLRSSRLAQNFREKALYGVHYHPERPCYISQLPRDLTNQISGLYVEPKGRLADAGFLAGRRRAVYISSFRLEPPLPRRRFYGAL
jgi:hypothetical protein